MTTDDITQRLILFVLDNILTFVVWFISFFKKFKLIYGRRNIIW